jgi:diguanylate cyclase (GGDEF)-like protein
MSDLELYFAKMGGKAFLGYTQTLIALIDGQGQLLEWNPAFNIVKSGLPNVTSIQHILTEPSQKLFQEILQARETRQTCLNLITAAGQNDFNCLFSALSGGIFLFCAEGMPSPGGEQITRLENQLNQARRTIMIKEVELKSVLAQADEISHTDAMTFLPNRRRVIAELQREVNNCERYPQPLTIFMADIDHFKQINDSYGHPAGDLVLRTLAGELQGTIRQTDLLGRYGGEEFLFILPGTAWEPALRLAERLLDKTRALSIALEGEQAIHLTISLGIAQFRIWKESWEDLLKRADMALYKSKENGRNRFTISD